MSGTFYFLLLPEQVIDGSTNGVNNFDRFGETLVTGDFDGDGIDDLAIGAPLDNSLGVVNAGEVTVLYGTGAGLSIAGVQIFDMIFFDTLEVGDEFGFALSAAKLSPGASADGLLIGIPGRPAQVAKATLAPQYYCVAPCCSETDSRAATHKLGVL